MTFPSQAIEACEGLSHPLPFPCDSECGAGPQQARSWQRTDAEMKAEVAELAARIDKWFATKYAAPAAREPQPSSDDAITEWLHREEGGAKVDTTHPGPIVMLERPSLTKRLLRRHGATVAGALFALVLISASMFLTPDVTEQLMRLAR